MSNQTELLKELKRIRIDYDFHPLDSIIKTLARDIIRVTCKHAIVKPEVKSCFYGTYIESKCEVCGHVLKIEKNW